MERYEKVREIIIEVDEMKIGLIDIDSKLPNLALMKLSAYFKSQGNKVELTSPLFADQFDEIYASKVFTYTEMPILPKHAVIGGSGVDLKYKLSDEIEHLMPDYSLYPNMDYSLGFTTRGCIRNCKFCIVPEKEGKIKINADIYEFWNRKHKGILLLDNNIFAAGNHFENMAKLINKEALKVDFNQGLDIRLLTNERAKILKNLHPLKQWRFAFDSISQEKVFRRGAEMLLNNNISKSRICIYLFAGFDEDYESTLRRVRIVYEEYGFDPFVMLYQDFRGLKTKHTEMKHLKKWGRDFKELRTILNVPSWKKYNNFKDFARWVNRKEIFKSVSWQDYKYNKKGELK